MDAATRTNICYSSEESVTTGARQQADLCTSVAQGVKPGWTSHGGQQSSRETARSSPHCATSACSHHPFAQPNLPVGLEERPAGESDDITHELATEFTLSEAQIWRPSRRRDVGGTDPQPPPGSGQTRRTDRQRMHPPARHLYQSHRHQPPANTSLQLTPSANSPQPRVVPQQHHRSIDRQAPDMPPKPKQHPKPLPSTHPKEVADGLTDRLTD